MRKNILEYTKNIKELYGPCHSEVVIQVARSLVST